MGLFSHRDESAPEEVAAEPPRRHSSLFSKHTQRSVSPVSTTNTNNSTSPHRRSGILHRRDEDPTIIAARERVINAEAMEKEADRALASARLAVREAREHIKRLEREAAEEARLAKIKQESARKMSKRGQGLGRHGIQE